MKATQWWNRLMTFSRMHPLAKWHMTGQGIPLSLSSILEGSKQKSINVLNTYHIIKSFCKGMYEYYLGCSSSSIKTNRDIEVVVPWERLSNQRDEHGYDEDGHQASEPAYHRDAKPTEEVLRVVSCWGREAQCGDRHLYQTISQPISRVRGAHVKSENLPCNR